MRFTNEKARRRAPCGGVFWTFVFVWVTLLARAAVFVRGSGHVDFFLGLDDLVGCSVVVVVLVLERNGNNEEMRHQK